MRELERSIVGLEEPTTGSEQIAVISTGWRETATGSHPDADLVIEVNESLVMSRDRAEQQGREILGPAEDTPPENDAVRVAEGP
jgi:hypothetical protein